MAQPARQWRWTWADARGISRMAGPLMWSTGRVDTVMRELLRVTYPRPVRLQQVGTANAHEFATPLEAVHWLILNARRLTIRFQVRCGVLPGQWIVLTGSIPELGSWDPNFGVPLETTPEDYPIWSTAKLIGPGLLTTFSYKYYVCGGGFAPRYEDGPVRVGDLDAVVWKSTLPGAVTIIDSGVGLTWAPSQARFEPEDLQACFSTFLTSLESPQLGIGVPSFGPGSFGPANFPQIVWDHRSAQDRARIDGRYKLGEALGKGAFGCVRRAFLKHANTTLSRAVKQVRKSQIQDTTEFNREVRMMELMDHQNTLRLFEVFEDHRFVYLVLEICEGGDMLDFMLRERDSGCSEMEAAHLFRQMAAAVDHCHRQGVAHRDVKLENFLVVEKDSPAHQLQVKLCDMGLANRVPPKGFADPCGSTSTMAPEVLLAGKRSYGLACDLWSLGSVLYSLLSCSMVQGPDTGDDWKERLQRGLIDLEPHPWPSLSEAAVDMVKSLMCLDPAVRLTAARCLQHPWLSQDGPSHSIKAPPVSFGTAETLSEGLSRWFGHGRLGHFRKTALHVLAQQGGASKRLGDAFRKLDGDKDGQVSLRQLVDVLAAILPEGEENPHIVEWREKILPVLPEGAALGQTEFLAATMRAEAWWEEDRCWDVFRFFDHDRDGTISLEDLQHIFSEAATKERFTKEVNACGGRIDFPTFVKLMRDSVPLSATVGQHASVAATTTEESERTSTEGGRPDG